MNFLLHIETSSDICSVAVSESNRVLSLIETRDSKLHATQLTPFIQKALTEAQISINQLKSISVSAGPGSYTGLRIGVSVAKGLAYGLNIPLITINTLYAMSLHVSNSIDKLKSQIKNLNNLDNLCFCPALDARRMEVYTAAYTQNGQVIKQPQALIIDEKSFADETENLLFFGNGAIKIINTCQQNNLFYLPDIHPSASYLIQPATLKFENNDFSDIAYFEPEYIKEFFTTQAKDTLLK